MVNPIAEVATMEAQVLYLGFLSVMLSGGAYLVVRQALIRRELDETAKSLGETIRSGKGTNEVCCCIPLLLMTSCHRFWLCTSAHVHRPNECEFWIHLIWDPIADVFWFWGTLYFGIEVFTYFWFLFLRIILNWPRFWSEKNCTHKRWRIWKRQLHFGMETNLILLR